MRVFKNKWFHRWMKKSAIAPSVLCQAAREIMEGHVEADLGGGLFKKRIARPGSGKSGGHRVCLRICQEPKSEHLIKGKEALSLVAEHFFAATDAQVSQLIRLGKFYEEKCNERAS